MGQRGGWGASCRCPQRVASGAGVHWGGAALPTVSGRVLRKSHPRRHTRRVGLKGGVQQGGSAGPPAGPARGPPARGLSRGCCRP